MRILGYHEPYVDITQLRLIGKSDWFIVGALDGMDGRIGNRPRVARLKIRKLPRGKIQVYGSISRYRKHFKRLGGVLNAAQNAWTFPARAAKRLKSDWDLNRNAQLWTGVSDADLPSAHEEYSAGYVWGQRHFARVPTCKIAKQRSGR
jgi:hypothetical protein